MEPEDKTPSETLLLDNVTELERQQRDLHDSLQDFMDRYFRASGKP